MFDLLSLDGEDLRKKPLIERKEKLAQLLATQPRTGPLLYSDHVEGGGRGVFGMLREQARGHRLQARRRALSLGAAEAWLKIKCGMRQEFVIIGWRPSDSEGASLLARCCSAFVRAAASLRRQGRQRLRRAA